MSEKRSIEANAVSFSERLANSQVFATLFRDGMALVEETASYLDGAGRTESKKLERSAALVYATESSANSCPMSWVIFFFGSSSGSIAGIVAAPCQGKF